MTVREVLSRVSIPPPHPSPIFKILRCHFPLPPTHPNQGNKQNTQQLSQRGDAYHYHINT